MTKVARFASRPIIVDTTIESTIDPYIIDEESFPNSQCISKASMSFDAETGLTSVKVFVRWRKNPLKMTMYTYSSDWPSISEFYYALVDAKKNSKSVGREYHKLFTTAVYPYLRLPPDPPKLKKFEK
jgi:hypothetical protein